MPVMTADFKAVHAYLHLLLVELASAEPVPRIYSFSFASTHQPYYWLDRSDSAPQRRYRGNL
jgi:hypothetical protein